MRSLTSGMPQRTELLGGTADDKNLDAHAQSWTDQLIAPEDPTHGDHDRAEFTVKISCADLATRSPDWVGQDYCPPPARGRTEVRKGVPYDRP